MTRWKILVLAACLCLMSSCAYHLGSGEIISKYSSISLPYIEGDIDGSLQSILVKEMASTSSMRYLSSGGNLLLKVKLKEERTESIGFRYAVNNDGSMVDTLVATEDRLSVLAEVSVIQAATCCTLIGPVLFTAHVDYDFQPDSSNSDLVQFSLGQVDYRGAARDAARRPLYYNLSKQIVDYISSTW